MNSLQISQVLTRLCPGFVGVFAIDKVPYVSRGKMVVNTQTSNLPGEHWCAIVVRSHDIIYFDPLNLPRGIAMIKLLL